MNDLFNTLANLTNDNRYQIMADLEDIKERMQSIGPVIIVPASLFTFEYFQNSMLEAMWSEAIVNIEIALKKIDTVRNFQKK